MNEIVTHIERLLQRDFENITSIIQTRLLEDYRKKQRSTRIIFTVKHLFC